MNRLRFCEKIFSQCEIMEWLEFLGLVGRLRGFSC